MNNRSPVKVGVHLGLIGSADFCRRMQAALSSAKRTERCLVAQPAEAWGMLVAERPNAIAIEIGVQHSEKQQGWLRSFLQQLRDRFKHEIYVIVALASPDKLYYGGDLLFANDQDATPSGFVDTFITLAPTTIPSIPNITEQLLDAVGLVELELTERAKGRTPLPALADPGWVHSLADPRSRDLWMRWLPRYAGYTNENPIIIGETGTGKTRLAYAIHLLSGRSGPFISITPRDFSSSELIQAELFGAVAGAYTGAVDKWGLVKSAEKGTLFIDELQSIDRELQGKLITFIENKTYRRVGSTDSIKADVRFVFASNRPIRDMVESETLRDDFAFRLERVQLNLLPLRNRRLDIAAALAFALAKIRRERPQTNRIPGFTAQAYRLLFSHNWLGNLRQLENTVAQLCELADMAGKSLIDHDVVTEVFEARLTSTATSCAELVSQAAARLVVHSLQKEPRTLADGLNQLLEEARQVALEVSGGDVNKAANLLGESSHFIELLARSRQAERELKARALNGVSE